MSFVIPTLALVAIVGGMYFATHLLRTRFGVGSGSVGPKALKVVGRRQLEPRKSLYVVEIADRYVLVGTAEGSVSLIDHITAEEFAQMGEEPARPAQQQAPVDTDGGGSRDEQRFATVSESFQYFLGKAKASRQRSPELELVSEEQH